MIIEKTAMLLLVVNCCFCRGVLPLLLAVVANYAAVLADDVSADTADVDCRCCD